MADSTLTVCLLVIAVAAWTYVVAGGHLMITFYLFVFLFILSAVLLIAGAPLPAAICAGVGGMWAGYWLGESS